MGLNIKNERVHDLARRASQVTGLNQTRAIEHALTKLLAETGPAALNVEQSRRLSAIGAISARWQAPASDALRDVDDLYDEQTGLPR